jgi:hypothetical protein
MRKDLCTLSVIMGQNTYIKSAFFTELVPVSLFQGSIANLTG